MSDQTRLAALSDGPTSALINSAGAVRSFATGGAVAPTEAQKEAGNYRKGHVRVHGMDLSIETPKGAKRTGKGKDGKPWSVTMPAHYGYIRGTKGADGDHVDAYLGPHPGNPNVHVVDQVDADTGKFDEHKALIGFQSRQHALDHYNRGFSDGRGKDRVGAVTTLPAHKFRSWVEKGRRTRPLGTLRVNRTQDDPYLAGISQNHCTLDIDKRVPKTMVVKGKSFDPAKYLAVHETEERKHMDAGMKYEPAHRLALKAERVAVEADGIDWNGYQEQMHKLAAITQKEKNPHPPSDLYKGPFSNAEQRKLTREGDTAPNVKKYAEGGEVEGDEQGPWSDYQDQFESGPWDDYQQTDYSVAGEVLKRGAQAVLPGLGSIPAMVGGAELGSIGGPIGSLAGAAVGGIAANVSLRKIQDWFMDKLGISPDPEKAEAFQQEHPNLATAADIAGSLVGMGPGGAAVTGVQRAAMAGGQAAIEAGSEYLHTGELDPSDIAMAAAAGAAFPGLNRVGEPLGQLGSRLAAKVGIRAGRPDMAKGSEPMKALPAPPDYTVSSEGEAAAYPGGDDQVFSQAAAPRPGTPRENARPIYEMPREDWEVTRPGTRPPDNTAPGAENDIPTKTDEDITADKSAATPAHAGYDPMSTLSTSHEMAPPRKDTNIGNPQSYPAGSERDYRTTTDSNVHPTSSGAGNYPTAETLDPTTGGISQEVMQALTQDNGPGRNTSPRGLKAADKRMQKSMRVPFSGEAANENVEGGGQPTPSPLPELEARRGGEPTEEELNGVPPTPENVRSLPAPRKNFLDATREAAQKTPKEPEIIPPSSDKVQQAIDRIDVWAPSYRDPTALEENKRILERGGPLAEKMADHVLTKLLREPPKELSQPETNRDTQAAFKVGQSDKAAGNEYRQFTNPDMVAAYERGFGPKPENTGTVTKQPEFTGPLRSDINPKDQEALNAYDQGHIDVRTGKEVSEYPEGKYPIEKYGYAYDRGRNDAYRALRENRQPIGTEIPAHPNTGIVEGAVADTVAKLRERDLGNVADAIEKNPAIEPQARKILQDLTAKIEEHGAVSPEEMKRVTRIMDKIENKENPQEGAAQAKRESLQQQANLGEETVAAESTKVAREKQFAAQAAQSAFDKFKPTNNKVPTTVVDQDLFKRRLSDALEHAQKENLGKDPLSPMPRKRTAAQEWLRAASKLVNAKRITPKMITDFMSMEADARVGAKGADIRSQMAGERGSQILGEKTLTTDKPLTAKPSETASRAAAVNTVEDEILDRIDEEREYASLKDQGIENPGLDDKYAALAKRFFQNKDASVDIQKLMQSLRGVFGPQAKKAALDYRSRTPEGVKEAYAQTLSNRLFQIRQQGKDQRVALLKKAQSNPYLQDRANMQKAYSAQEQGDFSKMSPEEQANYNKTLKPVADANDRLYDNIEKLVPGILGPKVTNHIYRIAKGLHPLFGGDPLGMNDMPRGLSKTASMAKERKFMAIEDGAGGREVISPTTNGYTIWKGGNGKNFQNAAFEPKEGNVFRDVNGKVWTVKSALTPEIEANAKFENGKPAEYVHNAAMSIFEEHAYMSDMARHLQFFEDLKNDRIPNLSLPWKEITTTDPKVARDNGWQESTFPQMKGTYMTDHVRYVFDDFAKHGLKDDALDRLRNLSMGVTKLMFWTPVAHIMNVGAHGVAQRSWDMLNPGTYGRLFRTSLQAFQSVRNQDHIQSEIRQNGGGTVYGGVITNDFMGELGRAFGETVSKAPSQWDPIARVLGISTQDLASSVYRNSSKLMWAANDMIYTQSYLEKIEKGMSPQEAMIRTEQHIPNYRLPTTIMGSRAAAKVVGEPLAFAFSPYHYGVFNSYAHVVKDLAHGTGAERVDAIGKLMVMGAMGMVVYPLLDKAAGYITGNTNAEAHRRGPIAIPNAMVRAFQGKGDITQSLRSTMTLSPLAATAMEAYNNRDYANREILQKGTVARIGTGPNRLQAAGSAAVQEGEHLARGLVSPYGTAANALDAKRNLAQGLRDQLLDIKNPTPQATRYEQSARIKALGEERQRALKNQGRGPAERLYNEFTR